MTITSIASDDGTISITPTDPEQVALAPTGPQGGPGPAPEMRLSATDIEWRVAGGAWAQLVALAEIQAASHDHADATEAVSGFMSAADKARLDGIEADATADQTGPEIVASINAELGGADWQSALVWDESAPIPVLVNSWVAWAHGMPSKPKVFVAYLECVTGEGGYSAGDRVAIGAGACLTSASESVVSWATATAVGLSILGVIRMAHFGGTSSFTITASNWRVVLAGGW